MADTKENILHTALRLFARDGYEAASVSDIAGELGITKGALYKHYKNKQDIFNSIVERMYQIDAERAKKFEVPEETFDRSPEAYRNTDMDKITAFIEAQFHFLTEDEFARNFRKMLILEQRGIWDKSDPKQLALEFYAPFYLLLSISDALPENKEPAKLLTVHIERFIEKNPALRKDK